MVKLWSEIISGKGHICFTKPFLLKMDCKISGWRFLKFWFFYAGFSVLKQSFYEKKSEIVGDIFAPALEIRFS